MFIEFFPTRLVTGLPGKLHGDLQQYDGEAPTPEGKEHVALSGFRETVLYRFEQEIQCRTVPLQLTDAELAQWWEFAASCGAGEYFTFDALGTEAAPVNPQTVQMKLKSFQDKRHAGRLWEFGFTVIRTLS